MLRQDVVQAVAEGKFHIYPIKSVDEGIDILTGIEAGAPGKEGAFEEGTVNVLVDQELDRLAASWKGFAGPADKET